MLAIELRFPGGRYHATPWDSHVNEGVSEWPPSPWRVLRAVIACWHLTARDEVPDATLRSIIDALAAELPEYELPAEVVGAHTRHYMPLFAGKTTKVFDAFLQVPRDARVLVVWRGVSLDAGYRNALALVLSRLGYLGRAEAWVDARVCDSVPDELACVPVADATHDGRERLRLLAPVPPTELQRWRAAALDERTTRLLEEKRWRATEKGKSADGVELSAKDRAALDASLPSSVYEAMTVDTDVLRKGGWNRPPGSRWVDYLRPRANASIPTKSAREAADLPTVARYALVSQAPPRLTEAVFETDNLRRVLLKHSDSAPVFLGRDPASGALSEGHRHAFIFPEANGAHGHISHVTIYAPMGFDARARAALEELSWLWSRSGHDIQLVLLGVGNPSQFAGTDLRAGQCPLLASSKIWLSRTPFVPTRHPKWRAGAPRIDDDGVPIGSPQHDLVRLLAAQGLPRPRSVEAIDGTTLGGKRVRWLEFRTERRRGHGTRAHVHGTGFRLEFSTPVSGPIAVGYGAHFGLGYFEPAELSRR